MLIMLITTKKLSTYYIKQRNKKHIYKLYDPQNKRILAINEGINAESKKTGKTIRKAGISKKGRFNILVNKGQTSISGETILADFNSTK